MSAAVEPARPRLPIVPPEDAYACTMCGSCCRRPWTVGIGAEEHARYAAIDWGQHDPRLAGQTLWTPLGRAWVLARDAAGACLFLEADGRCLIHRVLGYAEKPQSCQSFPYSFIETPDAVRTSLSWATFGRRVGEAPAAGAVEGELAPAYERDRRANATFGVADRTKVELIDLFRELARRSDLGLDPDQRLLRVARVAGLVARGVLSPSDTTAVRRALLVPPPEHLFVRLLRGPLGLLVALPAIFAAPVRTEHDALRLLGSLARDVRRLGYVPPHLEAAGAPRVPLAALRDVRFERSAEADALWARFLADVLLDGLMVAPDDLRGWTSWVVTLYGHARWLAKWSAARAGRSEVSRDDVRWAMAEAPASTGPHWGPAGKLVRRLGRTLIELYQRPGVLARWVAGEP